MIYLIVYLVVGLVIAWFHVRDFNSLTQDQIKELDHIMKDIDYFKKEDRNAAFLISWKLLSLLIICWPYALIRNFTRA